MILPEQSERGCGGLNLVLSWAWRRLEVGMLVDKQYGRYATITTEHSADLHVCLGKQINRESCLERILFQDHTPAVFAT